VFVPVMGNSICVFDLHLQSQAGDQVTAINSHNTTCHVRTSIRSKQKERTLKFSQLAEPTLRNSF